MQSGSLNKEMLIWKDAYTFRGALGRQLAKDEEDDQDDR